MNPWSPAKPKPHLMRLEPRMMFDGAGAIAAEALADGAGIQEHQASVPEKTIAVAETAPRERAPSEGRQAPSEHTVIFVDPSVPDMKGILKGLPQDAVVVVLDPNRDGIAQISAYLKNQTDVDAVHIISHGRAGELQVGNAAVNADTIVKRYGDELAVFRSALSADADILIYGCDFGDGAKGRQAMQLIADATGADVAASDDSTGHADFGGDWRLEERIGKIETAVAVGANTQESWRHLMAPPVANNDSFSVAEDTRLTFNPRLNDRDPDGDALNIVKINDTTVAASGPGMPVTGGIVNVNAAGNLVFTPNADFNGAVSFTYTVSDGRGGLATATVNLTVLPSVDPVTNFVPDTQTMLEDSPLVFSTATGNAVRVNDPDNSILTVTLTATNGALTLSRLTGLTFTKGDGTADGVLTFTGTAANINAALEGMRFDGTPGDRHGPASFSIATNKPPTTSAAIVNGGYESPVIPAGGYRLLNEADVPGWETSATDSTIEIWSSGFNGVSSFEGRQFAELNANQASTLYQTITPAAGAPLGLSFAHRGRAGIDVMNTKVTDIGADGIRGTGDDVVLLNENFTDGATAWGFYERNLGTASGNSVILEFTAVSTAGGNRSVGNFLDGMTFGDISYQDRDTVNITIAAVRDIQDDTISTNEDTGATFNVITGTNGATADSFENSGRVVSSVTQPANGTVTFNANGTITYAPNANFHGTDTFTYTVTSGGTTETATVTMNVLSVNDAPEVNPTLPDRAERDGDSISYPAGSAFSDRDGDALTYTATGLPPGLSINAATGEISGTLGTSASVGGPYDITVKATDPSGATVSDTFRLTVANDAPAAVDDRFEGDEDTQVSGNVLANDTDSDGDTLTASRVSGPGNGTLLLNADGTFTYTPNANFTGIDSFTYRVTDADGAFHDATVTIDVAGLNDAPIANLPLPDRTAADSTTVSIPMGVEFRDPDGDTLTFSAEGLPPGLSINPVTGEITGTLESSASVGSPYVITVTATDPDGASASASFTLVATNPAPVAANDSFDTDEDTAVSGNVLSNDSDPDGDGTTATLVSGPDNGTLVLNPNGTFTYTPDANFTGTDSFTYRITDADGASTTATATFTVDPVNDAPKSVSDSFTTLEDTPVTIAVLSNDSDVESEPLSVTQIDGQAILLNGPAVAVTNGSVTLTAAGLVFVPNQNFNGHIAFNYTVSDGKGGTSVGAVTGIVTPVNDAPVAGDDRNTTFEEIPLVVPASTGLLAGDTDVDDLVLKIDSFSINGIGNFGAGDTARIPGVGDITINADGSYSFVPAPDYNGTVPGISYVVSDAAGLTDTGTLVLTVDPVNDAPTIDTPLPDRTARDGGPISYPAGNAFSDIDGDALTFTATGLPAGLSIDPVTGAITGTLGTSASVNGPYDITVTATDPSGATVNDTFRLTVTNPAPVAVDDSFDTDEDTAVSGSVLANDTDPDGDSLTATLVSGPGNGTLVLNADGTFTYTPGTDFKGTDTFTYRVTDADGAFHDATVTIDVAGINDAPVANLPLPDRTAVDSATVSIPMGSEFRDPDGDALTFSADGLPPGLSIDPATGEITGELDSSASVGSPYVITVTATDPDGASASASFTLTATNPAPVAVNDSFDTDEDATVSGNVLSNDSDPDGDSMTATLVSGTGNGTLVLNADGTFTYTPDANFTGTDTFTYRVTDADGASTTATVTFTVDPVNDPPIAVGDSFTTNEDSTVTIDVLSNDGDADGDPLTVSQVNGTAIVSGGPGVAVTGGIVTLTPAGLVFTPNPDYNGPTRFTYTVSDGNGGTTTASVSGTVEPVNDAPETPDPLPDRTVRDGGTISYPAGSAFSDIDGDALTFTATGLPPGLSIDRVTGEITGVLGKSASVNGPYDITVTATDPSGATVNDSFRLTVTNPAPVAVDDSVDADEDTAVSGNVLSNDSDPDGDSMTATLVSGVANGTLVLNTDGTFTYTPDANFTGTDTFIYRVTDADGASTTATVTINVAGDNDVPVAVDDTFTTDEDNSITIDVLGNDSDVDGDPLTVTHVNGTAILPGGPGVAVTGGIVTLSSTGLVFTPNPDYNGPTRFTYAVIDGNGGTATATVTGTVEPVNDAPEMSDPLPDRTARDGDRVSYPVGGVFSDRDGDTLTFTATGLPPGLSIDPVTGAITGILGKSASVNGPYDITVTATDSSGATISDTFRLTVTNPSPAAVDDRFHAGKDTTVTGNVLSNDSDPDGDDMTVSLISGVSNGTLVLNDDGTFTYTPDAGFTGTDSFVYRLTDADGSSETATVTIVVSSKTAPPVAVDDHFSTGEDKAVTIDVLGNDGDADGDSLTVTHVDGIAITLGGPGIIVTGGVVTLTDSGLVFTPNPGYTGSTDFTYTISDGDGGTATATVTGAVKGQAVTDVVIPPWYAEQTFEQTPQRQPYSFNDRDELEVSDLRIIPFVLEFANSHYGIGFDLPRALQRYAPTGAVETMKEGQRAFSPPLIKHDVTTDEERIEPYLPETDDLTDAPRDTKTEPTPSKGWLPEKAAPLTGSDIGPVDDVPRNEKSEFNAPTERMEGLAAKLHKAGSAFTQAEQRLHQALLTLEQDKAATTGAKDNDWWERHPVVSTSEGQNKQVPPASWWRG